MQYPRVRFPVVVAIFGAVGLASAAANLSSAGAAPSVETAAMIARPLFVWLLFGVLSMLAYECARRFPLDRRGWIRQLPAHAATLAGISFTHTLVYTLVMRLVARGSLGGLEGFNVVQLLGNIRGDTLVYGMMVGGYYLYAFVVRDRQREQDSAELRTESGDLFRERRDRRPAPHQARFVRDRLGQLHRKAE